MQNYKRLDKATSLFCFWRSYDNFQQKAHYVESMFFLNYNKAGVAGIGGRWGVGGGKAANRRNV